MGDTITHLPDMAAVKNLIRHSADELVPGGKMVCSFRDYSREPEGSSTVIPVCRDPDRIFLCRLDYAGEMIRVTDILYTRESGPWTRAAGTYPKIRIAPEALTAIMSDVGLVTEDSEAESGMITIIAKKPVSTI
jgi:hypothetical protein